MLIKAKFIFLILILPIGGFLSLSISSYSEDVKSNYLIIGVLLITIFHFLELGFRRRKAENRVSVFSFLLISFIAYTFLRGYTNRDFNITLLFPILSGILLGYLTVYFLETFQKGEFIHFGFVFLISFSLLAECAIGSLQLFGKIRSFNVFFPVTGSYENPAPYAIFIASSSVFVIVWMSSRQKLGRVLISMIVLTILAVFIWLLRLESRTAIIIFAGTLVIYLFVRKGLVVGGIVKKSFLLLFATIVLSIPMYFIKPGSSEGRRVILKISWRIFSRNPVFGVGHGNFGRAYNNEISEYFNNRIDRQMTDGKYVAYTKSALNDYIQILCEGGLIGLTLFLLILGLIIREMKMNPPSKYSNEFGPTQLKTAASFSLLALVASSFFTDTLNHLSNLCIFCVLGGIVQSDLKYQKEHRDILLKCKSRIVFGIIIIMIVTGASFVIHRVVQCNFAYYTIVRKPRIMIESTYIDTLLRFNEPYTIAKADRLIKAGQLELARDWLENSKNYFRFWRVNLELGLIYLSDKDFFLAERNLIAAQNLAPNLVLPKFYLAKLYFETQERSKFYHIAYRVLFDQDKIPSSRINELKRQVRIMISEMEQN